MSEEAKEYKTVSDLEPGLRGINIKIRCKMKNEEREVVSRKTGETLRVTEALVGDETGCVLLTLWNEDIDKMVDDKVYEVGNGYTTIFKSSLRLNIGKYGTLDELEGEEPAEINEENNLSDKVYERQPRYRRYGGRGRSGHRGGGRPYRSGPRRRY